MTPAERTAQEAARPHEMPSGKEREGFKAQHRIAAFLASVELHNAGVTIEDEDRFIPYLAQFIANWEQRGRAQGQADMRERAAASVLNALHGKIAIGQTWAEYHAAPPESEQRGSA